MSTEREAPIEAVAVTHPGGARFRAVIFDMDGLLLDSERPILESWLAAAREHDVELRAETLLNALGRRAADVRGSFRAQLPPDFPFDAVRARVQVLIAEARDRDGFPVKDGVQALLQRLHARGVPCAVASSTRREEVERRLTLVGLRSFFDALVGGDEVEHGKPAPDIFLLAAERLGVAPAQCLVFEDAEPGAHGAVAAGMQAVIVPDLKQPSAEAHALSLAVMTSLRHVDEPFADWFG